LTIFESIDNVDINLDHRIVFAQGYSVSSTKQIKKMYQEYLRLFEIGDKEQDIIIICIGFVDRVGIAQSV
jgi:hypothetical protein